MMRIDTWTIITLGMVGISALELISVPALTAGEPSSSVRIPVSGFILDSRTGALRSINGVPGAAILGPSLFLPFDIRQACFAPKQAFALALTPDRSGSAILIRGLREATVEISPVDSAMPDVDLMAMNEPGTAAVLYSRLRAQIQFIAGLPDATRVSSTVTLSHVSGQVTTMALDPAGSAALMGVANGDEGALYLVRPGEDPKYIAPARRPSAIILVNGGNDAIIAEGAADDLLLIKDFRNSVYALVLAGQGHGIHQPAALQLVDGKHLLIANAGSNNIVDFDLESGKAVGLVEMPDSPSRLERLADPLVFVLNELGRAPLLLLDTAQGRAVRFVPVD
jgi:hypothetical protein